MSVKCMLKAGLSKEEILEDFGTKDINDISIDDAIDALAKAETSLRQKQLQGLVQYKNQLGIVTYKGDSETAVRGILTNDVTERSAQVGAEKQMQSIANRAFAMLGDFMAAMKPTIFRKFKAIFGRDTQTTQQTTLLRNTVKAIFGEDVADGDAKIFAKKIGEVFEELRQRFNKAGGDIKELEGFGLPQRHDSLKVAKVKVDEWIDSIWDKIDRQRMIEQNRTLVDEAGLRKALIGVYENIRTNGMTKMPNDPFAPGAPRGTKMANKHQNHRFLLFRNADTWMEYQAEFGSGNVYVSITDHISSMSREIGLMEKLGPDPVQGWEYLKGVVKRERALQDGGATTLQKANLAFSDSTFDMLRASTSDETSGIGAIGQTIRNWNVATKLGGAFLAAITDHPFSHVTAQYNGLSSGRMMQRYIGGWTAKSKLEAAKFGLTAEHALDRSTAAFENTNGRVAQTSKAVSDFVMDASFLEPHTVAARQAFGVEFIQTLTEMANKPFSELSPQLRLAFDRYGIDEADWLKFGKGSRDTMRGVEMINPVKLDQDLQAKFSGMILTETDYAVPTPGASERAIATFGTDAGTVAGEFIRSVTQFKSFPLTIMLKHWGRAAVGQGALGGAKGRLSYAAQAFALSSFLGTGVYVAKQYAAGKTTPDLSDPKTHIAGMLQGGSLALIGDFLLDTQGYHSGFSGGPVFDGPVKDLLHTLVLGNIDKIANGKPTTLPKDAVDFIRKNFPGNNIWYARLALERAIWDNLRSMADPDYVRNQQAKMRKLRRETGQEYWSKPTGT